MFKRYLIINSDELVNKLNEVFYDHSYKQCK